MNLLGAPAAKASRLTVDGVWGGNTSAALEYFFSRVFPGVKLDQGGWIRRQPASRAAENPGLSSGWEWVPDDYAIGSPTIDFMQLWLGVDRDGLIGPATIRARQGHGWRPGLRLPDHCRTPGRDQPLHLVGATTPGRGNDGWPLLFPRPGACPSRMKNR